MMSEEAPKFLRSARIEGRQVDRAAELLDAQQHQYFGVNRAGARIWSLLEQPRSVAELVQVLVAEFSVDETLCRRQTEAFVNQLVSEKLVTRLG